MQFNNIAGKFEGFFLFFSAVSLSSVKEEEGEDGEHVISETFNIPASTRRHYFMRDVGSFYFFVFSDMDTNFLRLINQKSQIVLLFAHFTSRSGMS